MGIRGTLEVEVEKGLVALVATRSDGHESRYVLDQDYSDFLGRKLISAAKQAAEQLKEVVLN